MDLAKEQDLLSIVSLCSVLADIIPEYKILDQETEGRLSNEIKAIRQFESSLLNLYTDYVEILIANKHDPTVFKCMCTLIKAKPHFNYMDKLAGYVVSGTTSHPKLVEGVLEEIFQS